jgi:hypothetical protein
VVSGAVSGEFRELADGTRCFVLVEDGLEWFLGSRVVNAVEEALALIASDDLEGARELLEELTAADGLL